MDWLGMARTLTCCAALGKITFGAAYTYVDEKRRPNVEWTDFVACIVTSTQDRASGGSRESDGLLSDPRELIAGLPVGNDWRPL